MKKFLTSIFLTAVFASFGQTGKLDCVCAESQIKADTKPDTIFYLQNGTPISLCGYKVKDSSPPVYLKFILAFCLPDTLLDIGIWTANESCEIRISGDTIFVENIEFNTIEKIYLQGLEVIHNSAKTVKSNSLKPIQTIERIFNNYIKYSESTDSQFNKDSMTKALQNLKQSKSETDLIVLINVWMYYDPIDFPSRDLIYKILANSRPESFKAVKTRIAKKKKWENDHTAPYSELKDLLKKLKK